MQRPLNISKFIFRIMHIQSKTTHANIIRNITVEQRFLYALDMRVSYKSNKDFIMVITYSCYDSRR